jgi:hypothetical protein
MTACATALAPFLPLVCLAVAGWLYLAASVMWGWRKRTSGPIGPEVPDDAPTVELPVVDDVTRPLPLHSVRQVIDMRRIWRADR